MYYACIIHISIIGIGEQLGVFILNFIHYAGNTIGRFAFIQTNMIIYFLVIQIA